MRDADRISDLHFATIRETRRHDVFRDPSRRVRARAIDLRGILARKRAAAVARHSAIRVGDNFATRQAGVAFWTADNKAAGRIDVNARS